MLTKEHQLMGHCSECCGEPAEGQWGAVNRSGPVKGSGV